MRVLKYIVPLWVGIVVYTAAAVTMGKTGLGAFDALLFEKENQLANLKKLTELNAELSGARDALKYDTDTIAVYARELGFGYEDERFIRIVGMDNIRVRNNDEGEILHGKSALYIDDKSLRIAALCSGGIVFLFVLFTSLLKLLAANRYDAA